MRFQPFFVICLAVSAAAHVLPWLALPSGGTQAAGGSGEGQVTLTAAPATLARQVAQWARPPEVTVSPKHVPLIQPQAEPAPAISRPQDAQLPLPAVARLETVPATAPEPPPIRTAPAPPPEPEPVAPKPALPQSVAPQPAEPKPVLPKPRARPARPTVQPKAPSVAVQEQAAGSGRSTARGDGGSDAVSTGDAARAANLKTRWGAAILARIERRKRTPRGGGEGRVTVRLDISTKGQLVSAAIEKSSGLQPLDQAALQAARTARYPRAPKALRPGTFSFRFKITFQD